jgi:hypothetical protein
VTEDEPRDDGPHPVELEQGRARLGNGIGDPTPGGGDVAIETTHVGQLLAGQALALDLGDPHRADRAHQLGGPIGRQAPGGAARDELTQGGMKPAGRLGAETGEVVVAIHQHPDHRAVLIDADRSQPAMA